MALARWQDLTNLMRHGPRHDITVTKDTENNSAAIKSMQSPSILRQSCGKMWKKRGAQGAGEDDFVWTSLRRHEQHDTPSAHMTRSAPSWKFTKLNIQLKSRQCIDNLPPFSSPQWMSVGMFCCVCQYPGFVAVLLPCGPLLPPSSVTQLRTAPGLFRDVLIKQHGEFESHTVCGDQDHDSVLQYLS